MADAKLILFVSFKTPLSLDAVMRIANERAPEFQALAGLKQKYYVQDPETGEICGLYIWESAEAFDAYRNSELRKTIAAAYQAQGEPRVELFNVLKTLREAPGGA